MKLRVALVAFFISSTLAAGPEAGRKSDNGCRDDEVQRVGYDCDLTCCYVADRRSRGQVADYLDDVFCKVVTKEKACYCKPKTYRNTADGSCMSWEDCPFERQPVTFTILD
ncbi:hypothetical protein ASPTUDRAFT_44450 [Aspergillus tubingensis CBS 134.48]|uniref:TIL domain-containing protein n=1 Tax=Aspergillus tubingensis (strain CBS 134.48) TaxID=767770 RepID=A0A1L9N1G9_ASPTC|nr:hypothetical protein ASPTUDRAFT_44450 [Aspergillus tubingensis CBS 134.48]